MFKSCRARHSRDQLYMKVKPCEGSYLSFFIGIAIVTEALIFYNSGHMVMWFWRREFGEGQGKA